MDGQRVWQISRLRHFNDRLRDELGFVAIPIERAIDEQIEVGARKLALFGHPTQQAIVDLTRAMACLGEDGRLLACHGIVVKVVVIAFLMLKALALQAFFDFALFTRHPAPR